MGSMHIRLLHIFNFTRLIELHAYWDMNENTTKKFTKKTRVLVKALQMLAAFFKLNLMKICAFVGEYVTHYGRYPYAAISNIQTSLIKMH